jgi:hypothetical protein
MCKAKQISAVILPYQTQSMAHMYRGVGKLCVVNSVQVLKKVFLDKVTDKEPMFTYVESMLKNAN